MAREMSDFEAGMDYGRWHTPFALLIFDREEHSGPDHTCHLCVVVGILTSEDWPTDVDSL